MAWAGKAMVNRLDREKIEGSNELWLITHSNPQTDRSDKGSPSHKRRQGWLLEEVQTREGGMNLQE
jgi:hypothetical protein